jgi:hypothetical protein
LEERIAEKAARSLLSSKVVKKTASTNCLTNLRFGSDMIDVMEEMLFERAANGIRPMLYVSSFTDLECSMLMLLDETAESRWPSEQAPTARQVGYHIITN